MKDSWIWIIGLAVLLSCAGPFMFPAHNDGSPEAITEPCVPLKEQYLWYKYSNASHGLEMYAYGNEWSEFSIFFLEEPSFSADSITLVHYAERDVGNAGFIIDEVTEDDGQCVFILSQFREIFMGVLNNSGMAAISPSGDFRLEIKACCSDFIVGDTIGLAKI